MFQKWTQYSYAAQKDKRHRLLKVILLCVIFIIIYNLLTAFFFSVWSVENDTMQPGLNSGDRLIFSSFTPPWGQGSEENQSNFRRGSIVLIDKNNNRARGFGLHVIDGIVRFFTAQRISIFSGEYYIKRIIGLPGDEISMNEFLFRIRAHGDIFSLTEFELSQRPYSPAMPTLSALWTYNLPFSGNMEPIILAANEYFVVSDDRSNTNDSRTWGAVSSSQIKARAVLRIWPFNRINLL